MSRRQPVPVVALAADRERDPQVAVVREADRVVAEVAEVPVVVEDAEVEQDEVAPVDAEVGPEPRPSETGGRRNAISTTAMSYSR